MQRPNIEVIIGGRIKVRDGFRAVYFINAPHSSLRDPVSKALDCYMDAVGFENLRLFVDEQGDTNELTSAAITDLLTSRFSDDYELDGGLAILSTDIGIADARFYYYGTELPDPRNPGLRNYVDLWFPTKLFHERGADGMAKLFTDIGNLFPLSSAYASPALLYNQEVAEAARRTVRFPGFDILDPAAVCVDIGNRIPGVYWLLLIGQDLAGGLGGVEMLRSRLFEGATVTPSGESLCIRLGPEPVVGDRNRQGREMDLYRSAAHLLEPLLHEPKITYILDESGLPDREALERWYRRFLK